MPVAERGHDPCWLLRKVYDDHQPIGGSRVALEEPLPIGPALWFSMVGRVEGVQDGLQMRLKLGVALVWIQDVQQPGVLKEDDALRCPASSSRPGSGARSYAPDPLERGRTWIRPQPLAMRDLGHGRRGYLRLRTLERPAYHLDLALVRDIVRVALSGRQIAMAHPLLLRAHRHRRRRHRRHWRQTTSARVPTVLQVVPVPEQTAGYTQKGRRNCICQGQTRATRSEPARCSSHRAA